MIKTNLAVLMAERGLKIADVYEATGISKTTLMAISENTGKGIQYETIDKLCNFFNVTPKDFFIYSPYMVSFSELKYDGELWIYINCLLKSGEHEQIENLQLSFNSPDNLKEIFDELYDKSLESYDFVLGIDTNLGDFYSSLPIQFKRDFRTTLIKNVLKAISNAKLANIPKYNESEVAFIKELSKIKEKTFNSFIYIEFEDVKSQNLFLDCKIKANDGKLSLI